jgi:hypothetical protein
LDAVSSAVVGVGKARKSWRLWRGRSKLGHGLQLPNHPTIGSGRHEDDKVHDDMLIVDDLSSIRNLELILGGIVQLHDIAFRRVKHHLQPVTLICVSLPDAGVLLFGYSLEKFLLCLACERALQRISGAELESLNHTRPCETIVAKDPLLGQAFDLARTGFLRIEFHFDRRVGAKRIEHGTKQ